MSDGEAAMTDTWLTIRQVALHLQVNTGTVRRWIRAGRLKGMFLGGRAGYRINERELQQFLEEEVQ